jgi:hypothetical protein
MLIPLCGSIAAVTSDPLAINEEDVGKSGLRLDPWCWFKKQNRTAHGAIANARKPNKLVAHWYPNSVKRIASAGEFPISAVFPEIFLTIVHLYTK